jgi:hypothetical protein
LRANKGWVLRTAEGLGLRADKRFRVEGKQDVEGWGQKFGVELVSMANKGLVLRTDEGLVLRAHKRFRVKNSQEISGLIRVKWQRKFGVKDNSRVEG